MALARYVLNNWALKEAVLQTSDYKLFGMKTGRIRRRVKHDKALLYVLAEESAFERYTVMTLISDKPKIYVFRASQQLLAPDQLRAAIAHELGHSWSPHIAGYEVVNWLRRLFLIPILMWATSALLSRFYGKGQSNGVLFFLTLTFIAWQLHAWISTLIKSGKMWNPLIMCFPTCLTRLVSIPIPVS